MAPRRSIVIVITCQIRLGFRSTWPNPLNQDGHLVLRDKDMQSAHPGKTTASVAHPKWVKSAVRRPALMRLKSLRYGPVQSDEIPGS